MKSIVRWAAILVVKTKWYLLGDYYDRLLVQARYLYKQSPLYKERWQLMGLDYAEETFENVAFHFFAKAKKEPLQIRGRILLDSILRRPAQPYFIRENNN